MNDKPHPRHDKIVEIVKRKGSAQISQLAKVLDVSPVTLRRDIAHLSSLGMLHKTHGKVIWGRALTGQHSPDNLLHIKQALSKRAAELVSDNQVLILDGGGTIMEMTRLLRQFSGLSILTTNVAVAYELAQHPNLLKLNILGGEVLLDSLSCVGHGQIEKQLHNMYFDWIFFSLSGIDLQSGVTSFYAEDVRLMRLFLKAARKNVAVFDSSKIGQKKFLSRNEC